MLCEIDDCRLILKIFSLIRGTNPPLLPHPLGHKMIKNTDFGKKSKQCKNVKIV